MPTGYGQLLCSCSLETHVAGTVEVLFPENGALTRHHASTKSPIPCHAAVPPCHDVPYHHVSLYGCLDEGLLVRSAHFHLNCALGFSRIEKIPDVRVGRGYALFEDGIRETPEKYTGVLGCNMLGASTHGRPHLQQSAGRNRRKPHG